MVKTTKRPSRDWEEVPYLLGKWRYTARATVFLGHGLSTPGEAGEGTPPPEPFSLKVDHSKN